MLFVFLLLGGGEGVWEEEKGIIESSLTREQRKDSGIYLTPTASPPPHLLFSFLPSPPLSLTRLQIAHELEKPLSEDVVALPVYFFRENIYRHKDKLRGPAVVTVPGTVKGADLRALAHNLLRSAKVRRRVRVRAHKLLVEVWRIAGSCFLTRSCCAVAVDNTLQTVCEGRPAAAAEEGGAIGDAGRRRLER